MLYIGISETFQKNLETDWLMGVQWVADTQSRYCTKITWLSKYTATLVWLAAPSLTTSPPRHTGFTVAPSLHPRKSITRYIDPSLHPYKLIVSTQVHHWVTPFACFNYSSLFVPTQFHCQAGPFAELIQVLASLMGLCETGIPYNSDIPTALCDSLQLTALALVCHLIPCLIWRKIEVAIITLKAAHH